MITWVHAEEVNEMPAQILWRWDLYVCMLSLWTFLFILGKDSGKSTWQWRHDSKHLTTCRAKRSTWKLEVKKFTRVICACSLRETFKLPKKTSRHSILLERVCLFRSVAWWNAGHEWPQIPQLGSDFLSQRISNLFWGGCWFPPLLEYFFFFRSSDIPLFASS